MDNKYDKLTKKFAVDHRESFIRSIRFPRYRNLEPNLRLDFHHPVTALVGPNGTNKSSILRALQACPRGFDLGTYWFETELDKIDDRTRYIHSYRLPSGGSAEVAKSRVFRSGRRRDYFETSRPRPEDGMAAMPPLESTPGADRASRGKTRWKPVPIEDVIYLDFRQELPAHNIALYFEFTETPRERRAREQKKLSTVDAKKEFIRKRSSKVHDALERLAQSDRYYQRERIHIPAHELSAEELGAIATVTGREYSRVRIVHHAYFGNIGATVQLRTDGLDYSEAAAGSGEFASIMLVHALYAAPRNSLVLLDEPETSLHPAAQVALTRVLIERALTHDLQVVIATHSPEIINELKPPSIKVLDSDRVTGKVRLVRDCALPSEAFNRIGAHFSRPTVLVEDRLAAEFIRRAARTRGFELLDSFVIEFPPGGESVLKKSFATTIPLSGARAAIVLDGDQNPAVDLAVDATTAEVLQHFGINAKDIPRDSVVNGASTDAATRVAQWCREKLRFLPGSGNPEQLLATIAHGAVLDHKQAKVFWAQEARKRYGLVEGEEETSEQIFSAQAATLAALDDSNEVLKAVAQDLEELLQILHA